MNVLAVVLLQIGGLCHLTLTCYGFCLVGTTQESLDFRRRIARIDSCFDMLYTGEGEIVPQGEKRPPLPPTRRLYAIRARLAHRQIALPALLVRDLAISDQSYEGNETATHLGSEEELQGALLKVELDEQGDIVAHVERDFCGEGG